MSRAPSRSFLTRKHSLSLAPEFGIKQDPRWLPLSEGRAEDLPWGAWDRVQAYAPTPTAPPRQGRCEASPPFLQNGPPAAPPRPHFCPLGPPGSQWAPLPSPRRTLRLTSPPSTPELPLGARPLPPPPPRMQPSDASTSGCVPLPPTLQVHAQQSLWFPASPLGTELWGRASVLRLGGPEGGPWLLPAWSWGPGGGSRARGRRGRGGRLRSSGWGAPLCVCDRSAPHCHRQRAGDRETSRHHTAGSVPVARRSLPGWPRGRSQGENGRLGSELAKLRLETLSGRLSRCPLPWGRTGQSSWPLSKHRERRIANTRALVLALLPTGWVTLGQLLNPSVPPSMKSIKPAPPPSGCCEY